MKKALLSLASALLVFTITPKGISSTSSPTSLRQQSEEKAKIFSGTVLKNGDNFILSDAANKLSFVLDNAEKASPYEGKKVKVMGTVDVATNIIHVETIEEIA